MPLSPRRNGSHADYADTQIAIRAVFTWIRGRYAPEALTDSTDFTD